MAGTTKADFLEGAQGKEVHATHYQSSIVGEENEKDTNHGERRVCCLALAECHFRAQLSQ